MSGQARRSSTIHRFAFWLRYVAAMTDIEVRPSFLSAVADQFVVDDEDDPVLLTEPDRLVVDTWREGYPYDERMPREQYDVEKRLLQIELLKLQNWIKSPWTVVKSNDKKRARINAMRYVLSQFDYENKDLEVVGPPDPVIVGRGTEVIAE